MRIKRGAWLEYKRLFDYSRTARYEGFTDIESFNELKKNDHELCLKHLDNFKKHIKSQGLDCENFE